MRPVEVVSVGLDGTAMLADGRQVRLMVGLNGLLGCRVIEREEAAQSSVDQVGATPVPRLAQLGLDQV